MLAGGAEVAIGGIATTVQRLILVVVAHYRRLGCEARSAPVISLQSESALAPNLTCDQHSPSSQPQIPGTWLR